MLWFKNFLADQNGGTAIEYAMVIGIIAVASVITWGAMGDTLEDAYGGLKDEVDQAS